MSRLEVQPGPWLGAFEIELPKSLSVSASEFEDFCQRNPELNAELTSEGKLIIMAPTGGNSGWRNLELSRGVGNWAQADGTGIAFDSSTVFELPNGARRGPDVAWIRWGRWEALSEDERERFPPICPDFVIELRSTTDRLSILEAKLAEYIENGAVLGFLIDPVERCVHVYRPGAESEVIESPDAVSGDPELPGLMISLTRIWGSGR